jgi:hypothetical protein
LKENLSFCLNGMEEVSLFGGESKAFSWIVLPSLQFCAVKTGFQVQQQQQQQQQQHCEWAIFFPRLTILFESCTNRREEGVKLG